MKIFKPLINSASNRNDDIIKIINTAANSTIKEQEIYSPPWPYDGILKNTKVIIYIYSHCIEKK